MSQADPVVRNKATQIVSRYFKPQNNGGEPTVNVANSEELNGVIIGTVPKSLVRKDGDSRNVADSPKSDIMLGTTGFGYQQEENTVKPGIRIKPRTVQP